jgi:hypothetical protein
LADQYQAQGLDIVGVHAQFDDGSVSVEAGLADMLIRMESGRFKVSKHLTDWFDEYRLYHRKDGRVHKEGDDLMSATRYAVMMLRYARTDVPPKPRSIRRGSGSWMAA